MSSSNALQPINTGLLSHRVKQAILDAILDGAFETVLPSEIELARQLAVSRATVRGALRSLEEEGLITRQRGVGTRVNQHIARARLTLNRVVGFWDLIREAGHEPSLAYTRVREGAATLDVVQRFACAPATTFLMIDRLFLADGEPAILVTENLMKRDLRAEVSADDVHESIFEFTDVFTEQSIDHTMVEVVPAAADEGLSEELKFGLGDPLLRLIESCYTRENRLILIADIHVVDRFIRFNVIRRRT